ncbi:MAG TPA: MarR family winged helix-turn-helix transcriptional regulator [Paraburkholderia sp.]|nr:MarR family winged helix-turn-helix transcriptional regulator [Paraburkholderia sp.]
MYKLTDSFPYLLNRVGVRMGELFARRIQDYDITVPMYRVLSALCETRDQRLNDLAEMTTIEISTLSRLIGTLDARGLVSRSRLKNNARTVAINLTNEGESLIGELMPIAKHFEDVTIAQLSAKDRRLIKRALIDVYERLDEIEEEVTAGTVPDA